MFLASKKSKPALTSKVTAQMDDLLSSLADKVADARSTLSELAGDGATAAGESLDRVVKESKKGVKALDKRWRTMEPRHKVAVVGSLLAVLAAAAAAPAVVRRVRARR